MQSENGISNWNLKIQKNPKITKSREKNPNFFFHPKYGLWGLKSKGIARAFISSDKRPQKPRKNRSLKFFGFLPQKFFFFFFFPLILLEIWKNCHLKTQKKPSFPVWGGKNLWNSLDFCLKNRISSLWWCQKARNFDFRWGNGSNPSSKIEFQPYDGLRKPEILISDEEMVQIQNCSFQI